MVEVGIDTMGMGNVNMDNMDMGTRALLTQLMTSVQTLTRSQQELEHEHQELMRSCQAQDELLGALEVTRGQPHMAIAVALAAQPQQPDIAPPSDR
jgi:hypothetical protein